MNTRAFLDKSAQPYSTYFDYDADTSGNKRIYVKLSTQSAKSLSMVYKKQPTLLVNDSDLSDLPANFRDMLVYKAAYNFLARGYGEQDASNLQTMLTDYQNLYTSMREECLPKKASGFSVNIGGYTPNTEMNTFEPNSWSNGTAVYGYDKRSL